MFSINSTSRGVQTGFRPANTDFTQGSTKCLCPDTWRIKECKGS